jgi:hypothetical protein
MKDFAILLGVLVLWIALNRWVLPWFGVPTCMSGECLRSKTPSCCVEPPSQDNKVTLDAQGESK